MKYSFIVPIYNTKKELLVRSYKSIQQLKLTDYEIIWINDGSTDVNLTSFCRVRAKEEGKIIYIEQTNQGSAIARNKGIEIATGDYLIFVDSDDYILDEFQFDDGLEIYDIECYSYYIENDGKEPFDVPCEKTISDYIKSILYYQKLDFRYDFGTIWSKRFSRKFLVENKILFKPELRKAQDRAFMLEFFCAKPRVKISKKYMYVYSRNLDSITQKRNMNMIQYYKILEKVINSICDENNICLENRKYFTYCIFFEMLSLTYFHKECSNKNFFNNQLVNEVFCEFEMDKIVKNLVVNDFVTIKSKMKFILLKRHFFSLLRLYYTK